MLKLNLLSDLNLLIDLNLLRLLSDLNLLIDLNLLSDLNLVDQPGLHRLTLFGAMNSSVEWFDTERGNLDELTEVITTQFWGRTL